LKRVSGFRFQVSGFKFQVSGLKFQVSRFKFQDSVFCEQDMKMRFFTLLTLLTFFLSLCTYAFGQGIWQADTETKSEGVLIQNSFPKGGLRYIDSSGNEFVYAIFWTRIVNETATPLELTINFPADSLAISTPPNNYLKLFLPPETMTPGKVSMFNYGLDLKSFLDISFHKPTSLQKTINPKGECVFYIATLSYMPYNGAVRAGLILKGRDLFYKINMLDSLVPCGQVVVKK